MILANTTKLKYYLCNESHPIYHYTTFLTFPVPERKFEKAQLKMCIVNLAKHVENKCKFKGCRKNREKIIRCCTLPLTITPKRPRRRAQAIYFMLKLYSILGSQSNFITNELAKKLQLSRKKVKKRSTLNVLMVSKRMESMDVLITHILQ